MEPVTKKQKCCELENELKKNFGIVVDFDEKKYEILLQIKKEEELKFSKMTQEELKIYTREIKLFNFLDSEKGQIFKNAINDLVSIECDIDEEFKNFHGEVKKMAKVLKEFNN